MAFAMVDWVCTWEAGGVGRIGLRFEAGQKRVMLVSLLARRRYGRSFELIGQASSDLLLQLCFQLRALAEVLRCRVI